MIYYKFLESSLSKMFPREPLEPDQELHDPFQAAAYHQADEGRFPLEELSGENHHVLLREEKLAEIEHVGDDLLVELLGPHDYGCIQGSRGFSALAVRLALEALLEGLLVYAHRLHSVPHPEVVFLVKEDAGERHLHDRRWHQDHVEDSLHLAPVGLLGLLRAVDDDPAHPPPRRQVPLGRSRALEYCDLVDLVGLDQLGKS